MTLWIISDTHFTHANFLNFTDAAGNQIRPFSSVQEMDDCMVTRWNETVRPGDHVYHLGDVAMRREHLAIVKQLHGKKRLVRGNHDIFKTKDYLSCGFQEIYGVRVLHDMIFSHIPLHPLSLGRFLGNVHGHLHDKPSPPGKYLNVSVEQTLYRPLSLEEVRTLMKAIRHKE